jgi:hypothetical protein
VGTDRVDHGQHPTVFALGDFNRAFASQCAAVQLVVRRLMSETRAENLGYQPRMHALLPQQARSRSNKGRGPPGTRSGGNMVEAAISCGLATLAVKGRYLLFH